MRPVIVLCTTDIEQAFATLMFRGVYDAAKQFDFNLMVLPGKALKVHYEYEYQYNVLYDYIDPASVNGIIISGGSVSNFIGDDAYIQWCERFHPIPIVSIAARVPHGSYIRTDNEDPFAEAVTHLIRDHGRKKVAFIAGSVSNPDSAARFNGYRKALAAAHVEFDENLVFHGDFTRYSGSAAL